MMLHYATILDHVGLAHSNMQLNTYIT